MLNLVFQLSNNNNIPFSQFLLPFSTETKTNKTDSGNLKRRVGLVDIVLSSRKLLC